MTVDDGDGCRILVDSKTAKNEASDSMHLPSFFFLCVCVRNEAVLFLNKKNPQKHLLTHLFTLTHNVIHPRVETNF